MLSKGLRSHRGWRGFTARTRAAKKEWFCKANPPSPSRALKASSRSTPTQCFVAWPECSEATPQPRIPLASSASPASQTRSTSPTSWRGRREYADFLLCTEPIDYDFPPQSRFRSQRSDVRRPLSQSERDWMYAKRALARGDDPEGAIRQIAYFPSIEKSDPLYYARLTVKKVQANMRRESTEATSMR